MNSNKEKAKVKPTATGELIASGGDICQVICMLVKKCRRWVYLFVFLVLCGCFVWTNSCPSASSPMDIKNKQDAERNCSRDVERMHQFLYDELDIQRFLNATTEPPRVAAAVLEYKTHCTETLWLTAAWKEVHCPSWMPWSLSGNNTKCFDLLSGLAGSLYDIKHFDSPRASFDDYTAEDIAARFMLEKAANSELAERLFQCKKILGDTLYRSYNNQVWNKLSEIRESMRKDTLTPNYRTPSEAQSIPIGFGLSLPNMSGSLGQICTTIVVVSICAAVRAFYRKNPRQNPGPSAVSSRNTQVADRSNNTKSCFGLAMMAKLLQDAHHDELQTIRGLDNTVHKPRMIESTRDKYDKNIHTFWIFGLLIQFVQPFVACVWYALLSVFFFIFLRFAVVHFL